MVNTLDCKSRGHGSNPLYHQNIINTLSGETINRGSIYRYYALGILKKQGFSVIGASSVFLFCTHLNQNKNYKHNTPRGAEC